MESTKTREASCDVCHQKVVGGLRTWRRRMPSPDRIGVCAACSYRLARSADGRGREDEDMMHMVAVSASLAGEIWADQEQVYWFREAFIHRMPVRMADLLDRERPEAHRFSELTRRELARVGVRL